MKAKSIKVTKSEPSKVQKKDVAKYATGAKAVKVSKKEEPTKTKAAVSTTVTAMPRSTKAMMKTMIK